MNQKAFEENTYNRRQAMKNRCEKDTIGFSFVSLWLKKWRGFCKQITDFGKAKPHQTQNYFFDTQLKTAPTVAVAAACFNAFNVQGLNAVTRVTINKASFVLLSFSWLLSFFLFNV